MVVEQFVQWLADWFSTVLINSLVIIASWRIFLNSTSYIVDVDHIEPAVSSHINCRDNYPYNIIWRTLDGTCNDLNYPEAGSVGTRFKRMNIEPDNPLNINPETDTLLEPNPRTIARKLLFPNTEYPKQYATHLNMLTAAWVSFMTDDWMDHGHAQLDSTIDIPLEPEDPLYTQVNQIMSIFRTRDDDTYPNKPGDGGRPQTFQNTVTAWWDASQIYGTDTETNEKLRDPNDRAKFLIGEDGGIPIINNKEQVGFNDNWWLGKSLLLNLFILEHNYFVDALRNYFIPIAEIDYPGDEWAFQTARLVISGLIAKIHTVEWTPAILGNEIGENIMMFNWYGTEWLDYGLNRANENGYSIYKEKYHQFNKMAPIDASETMERTASLFSYESHLILRQLTNLLSTPENKIMGGLQNTGGYYNFLEEFVGVYRFHSILPEEIEFNCMPNITMWQQIDDSEHFLKYCIDEDEFNLRNLHNDCSATVKDTSFILGHDNIISLREKYSIEDLIYTFGTNHPTGLHLYSYSNAMTSFFDDRSNTILDLATIDILRQRERGVHRYNDFRVGLGMPRIESYEELIDDDDVIKEVESIYQSIDDLDFLVGLLLENQGGKRVPPGWIFGETSFALFILSASNRLKADRFFTDFWNDDTYTVFGRLWIERNSLNDVIQRHFPELRPFLGRNAFHTFFDGICDDDDDTPKPTNKPTNAPTPMPDCPYWCKSVGYFPQQCKNCRK